MLKFFFHFFWLEHPTYEHKGNKLQVFGNAHLFIYYLSQLTTALPELETKLSKNPARTQHKEMSQQGAGIDGS